MNFISISFGDTTNPASHRFGWKVVETPSFKDMSQVITKRVWSPCSWTGGARLEKNFTGASYCVLDFDDGQSAVDVVNYCRSNKLSYLIGTTKNHQRSKNGKICDRFRLVLKFKELICSVEKYRYNMTMQIHLWGSDKSCKDGARCYKPCREIITYGIGRCIDVLEKPPLPIASRSITYSKDNLPVWVTNFLNFGDVSRGRNNTCFSCSCVLKRLGYEKSEIVSKIKNSPFPRSDFDDNEIISAVESAFRSR